MTLFPLSPFSVVEYFSTGRQLPSLATLMSRDTYKRRAFLYRFGYAPLVVEVLIETSSLYHLKRNLISFYCFLVAHLTNFAFDVNNVFPKILIGILVQFHLLELSRLLVGGAVIRTQVAKHQIPYLPKVDELRRKGTQQPLSIAE